VPLSPHKVVPKVFMGQKPKLDNIAEPNDILDENEMIRNEMESMKEKMIFMEKVSSS